MEIVKLPPGKQAPRESDCISIDETRDGRFLLNASALAGCANDDDEADDDSVAVVGGDTYDSYEDAEAAGLAWAAERCVDCLYISRDASHPEMPD